jgi:peptidyl-prolyl cis-trans isomerase C
VRHILSSIVILVIAACSTLAGRTASSAVAQNAPAPPAVEQDAAKQDAAKPIPAQLPEVVARVNGENVTRQEFEEFVQNLEARAGAPVPADQRNQVYRRVLDQIVGYKLLLQEAKVRKVAVADGDIESRVNEIRKQFASEEVFTQALAERKMTLDQVRSDIRNDLSIGQLIDAEIKEKSAVKAEQLQDFYTKNPDQFKQTERVRASHILIGFPQNADAAARTDARTKAEQVLKEVTSGGDFAALAKQHSQDPGSAANGGDLGFFEAGQMVGPFNDAAFSLAPGTISDLVETQFGYHIIKVAEKQPARTIPLDEVRPQLEEFLQNQNRQEQTEIFVKSLRSKGMVEILI